MTTLFCLLIVTLVIRIRPTTLTCTGATTPTHFAVDAARLHVTFLDRVPTKQALKALETLSSGPDRFHCAGTEIYLHCPNGYGRTKLSNTAFERLLGLKATTRNWNTVNKLCELVTGSPD